MKFINVKKRKGKIICLFFVLLFTAIIAITRFYHEVSEESPTITLSFVGDIMLSRGVASVLDQEGLDYPYEQVRSIFLEDDFTLGNLECPLTDRMNPVNKPQKYIFKASMENADALYRNGFDCINLCNNHSTDYRSGGLEDTINALTNAGIGVLGAAKSGSEDMSYVFEKNGIKVGILAFTPLPTEGFFYDDSKACISYAGELKLDKVAEKIEALECDYKIVYFHFGVEFVPEHSDEQEKYAHLAIDHGADFVVGAHPHVIQDNEIYKGKPIYYSIGNFVFDHQIPKRTDETMILQLVLSKEGLIETREIPAKIKRAQVILDN